MSNGSGGGARAIGVSLNDFPVFDGVGCPESFIRQCGRVAALGGIKDDQLSAIMAARCRGLALQVIESSTESANVADLLKSAFAAQQQSPEAAAMQLSAIKKHSLSVAEYALQVKTLVKRACPELFDQTGSVKKICAPAYQAALYRHFLTGLTSEERLLLSRQGASSFDAAVSNGSAIAIVSLIPKKSIRLERKLQQEVGSCEIYLPSPPRYIGVARAVPTGTGH